MEYNTLFEQNHAKEEKCVIKIVIKKYTLPLYFE